MRAVRLALAAIALGACAKTGTPSADTSAAAPTTPSADTANSAASIRKLRDAWVAAANRKDAASVAAMYSEDAVMVTSDQPSTTGRAAIQAEFAKTFPISSDLKINSEKTEVSGDLAYDYGTYSEHIAPPKAKPMDVTGTYLVVIRKQSDGSWKIIRHFGITPPKG